MKNKNLFTEANRQKELRLIEAEMNPMLQLHLLMLHSHIWEKHDLEQARKDGGPTVLF